jgi:cellobiose-specific phosphotransferase system component IIC
MKTRLNRAANHGRVTPHSKEPAHRVTSLQKMMAKYIAIKNERKTMLLLSSPFLASALYIGGGGLGLVLLIIVIVLVLRR